MPDFSHLKALETTEQLSELKLTMIDGAPSLFLAYAGETNKPFLNAVLRRVRGSAGAGARSLTPAQLAEARETDREDYARHIVKRWERIVDAEGEPTPISYENALAFLRALPTWIFDQVRAHAGNPTNFLAEGTTEAGEQGKD